MVKIEKELCNAINQNNIDKISSMISKEFDKGLTLEKIEEIAKKQNFAPLQHAVKSCKKMAKLQETKIGAKELLEIAFFIETKLKGHIEKGHFYLKRDKTHLSRTIEHDPQTKQTFIHLKCHNGLKKIGKGYFKTVTKSILYSTQDPEVVAHCEQTGEETREMKLLQAVKGVDGLIQLRSMTTHKEASTGKNKISLIFTLFAPGALQHERMSSFSNEEKHKIAKDALKGLTGLHEKNITHRDIKLDNIFANKQQNKIKAVISDLGQSYYLDKAKGKPVHATPCYSAPEGFNNSLDGVDYKKADVFSLGCVFYEIIFAKKPSWMSHSELSKVLKEGSAEKKKQLKTEITNGVKNIREELKKLKDSNKADQKIKLLASAAYRMLKAEPNERISAKDALKLIKGQ